LRHRLFQPDPSARARLRIHQGGPGFRPAHVRQPAGDAHGRGDRGHVARAGGEGDLRRGGDPRAACAVARDRGGVRAGLSDREGGADGGGVVRGSGASRGGGCAGGGASLRGGKAPLIRPFGAPSPRGRGEGTCWSAPHPPLRGTFSPRAGGRDYTGGAVGARGGVRGLASGGGGVGGGATGATSSRHREGGPPRGGRPSRGKASR